MGEAVRAGQIRAFHNPLGQAHRTDRTGCWQPVPIVAYWHIGKLCSSGEAKVNGLVARSRAGLDDGAIDHEHCLRREQTETPDHSPNDSLTNETLFRLVVMSC